MIHLQKNQRQLLSLDEFLDFYNSFDSNLPLALNIKSDGLTMYIKKSLEKYQIKNYFLFDMSVPDLMEYQKIKLTFIVDKANLNLQKI